MKKKSKWENKIYLILWCQGVFCDVIQVHDDVITFTWLFGLLRVLPNLVQIRAAKRLPTTIRHVHINVPLGQSVVY